MSRNGLLSSVCLAIVGTCLIAITCAVAVAAPHAPPKPELPSLKPEPTPDAPAVAAILATKPTTPEECVRAAKTLADLGRADLAKGFLKKTLDAKLDRQQLADLSERVGSPVFLEIAGRESLQPEAKKLADAVSAAMKARLEDSKRIAGLVEQLQDPSPEKRLAAIVGLQEARSAAVGPLIAALADPARAAAYANVRAALAEMGSVARPPLVAIVEQADPKLAEQAIRVLGATKDSRVVLCLLRPCLSEKSEPAMREAAATSLRQLTGAVPSRAEAVRQLSNAATEYFERHTPIEPLAPGEKTELWRWDAVGRKCVARPFTPSALARTTAAQWARDAYAIAPDNPAVRILYLAATLEAAAYDNGLDRPLSKQDPAIVEAKRFGAKTVEEVLQYAMSHGYTAAATASARLLGQIGKADELLDQGVKPAPLVEAVQSPDRRLRLAALESIVHLHPTKAFAGSSYVPQALGFLAASSGFRHALVASPSLADGRDLAGMLVAAGYETDTYTNGRDMLLAAARSPNYELALIDVTIDHPVIGILLQQLRHDPPSASIRVGLIARRGYFDRAERLAESDPLAKAFARPHDDKTFRWQLDQLATLRPEEFVGFDARQREAAEALDLLGELSRSSNKLYDLRGVQKPVIAALYNPKLGVKAVDVLANINSAESQRALVEVASRFTLPLPLRQAAAIAFRQNTQKHGILLTAEEIRQQYRRYNESETMDAPTQHVLALILDCLEVGVPKKK